MSVMHMQSQPVCCHYDVGVTVARLGGGGDGGISISSSNKNRFHKGANLQPHGRYPNTPPYDDKDDHRRNKTTSFNAPDTQPVVVASRGGHHHHSAELRDIDAQPNQQQQQQQQCTGGGGDDEVEEELLRKDGSLVWISQNAETSRLGESPLHLQPTSTAQQLPQQRGSDGPLLADEDDVFAADFEDVDEFDCGGDGGGMRFVQVADWNEERDISEKTTSLSSAACSLAFTQQQAHTTPRAAAEPATAEPARPDNTVALRPPFCGWGLLHLCPRGVHPFEQNGDAQLLFRVLVGAVRATFASGLGRPLSMDAGPGDMFVVRPFNFYGLRNASADGEWAVLYCIYSRHGEGGATDDHAATGGSSSSRLASDGAEDEADGAEEVPAKRRRLCR